MNSTQQKDSFQSDIKALETWTRTPCMTFNVDKFLVLVINPSQSSPQGNYTLDGSPLQITQKTKYLGVVIQLGLKFTSYVFTKISKARQQLGIIKLQRKQNCWHTLVDADHM